MGKETCCPKLLWFPALNATPIHLDLVPLRDGSTHSESCGGHSTREGCLGIWDSLLSLGRPDSCKGGCAEKEIEENEEAGQEEA